MTHLELDNFATINVKDKLVITSDTASGITSLPVVNSEGIIADDVLVLGNLIDEYSEQLAAAHTGFAPDHTHVVASTATLSAHKQFDPLWVLYGDKIKVWRAPNVDGTPPADNTFTLLTTIAIDYDEASTAYQDAAGSSAYWYKITYLNSITSTETAIADSPILIRGGDYGEYSSLENIRREAGLSNNNFITDSMVNAARYRAQYEIDGALNGLYIVPFVAPINPMVSALTEKLAAFYLLSTDYGPMASGNSKAADVKMAEYTRLMTKIDNKQYVLTDNNGNDLSIDGAGGNKSWPNSTTSTQNGQVTDGYSDRQFRYGMRF